MALLKTVFDRVALDSIFSAVELGEFDYDKVVPATPTNAAFGRIYNYDQRAALASLDLDKLKITEEGSAQIIPGSVPTSVIYECGITSVSSPASFDRELISQVPVSEGKIAAKKVRDALDLSSQREMVGIMEDTAWGTTVDVTANADFDYIDGDGDFMALMSYLIEQVRTKSGHAPNVVYLPQDSFFAARRNAAFRGQLSITRDLGVIPTDLILSQLQTVEPAIKSLHVGHATYPNGTLVASDFIWVGVIGGSGAAVPNGISVNPTAIARPQVYGLKTSSKPLHPGDVGGLGGELINGSKRETFVAVETSMGALATNVLTPPG